MKKNSLNVFERFAQAYFKFVNGEDQRYLVRINGIVVTEVITSKDELKEAVDGALTVNPKSDVEVYMVADIDLFEDETDEEPVEPETDEEVADEANEETEETVDVVEEATEELSEVSEDTVVETDEALKDFPRKSKSMAKAEKKAAKLEKKAKKAKKKAEKAEKKAHPEPVIDEDVANWETPSPAPVEEKTEEVHHETPPYRKPKKKAVVAKPSAVGATQAVQQLDKDTGAVLATFDSVSHAAQALGINATNISKVANGHRKTTGGFGWKKI